MLAGAARVFLEQGIHRVSMRCLAAALDTTPSVLYGRFGSKADLLARIQSKSLSDLHADMNSRLERAASAEEKLRAVIRSVLDHRLAYPSEAALCRRSGLPPIHETCDGPARLSQEVLDTVTGVVAALGKRPEGMTARTAAQALLGMLDAVLSDPDPGETERRLTNQITNLFLNGMKGYRPISTSTRRKRR